VNNNIVGQKIGYKYHMHVLIKIKIGRPILKKSYSTPWHIKIGD
jgi:hypothetical protein